MNLNRKIVDLVDPLNRAYGAGYSAFLGEWAVTNAKIRGSVNNFALHLSLETPPDGGNSRSTHSGYSTAQYDSLALVLKNWIDRFGFTPAAITTHRHVDLGGERVLAELERESGDPVRLDRHRLGGRPIQPHLLGNESSINMTAAGGLRATPPASPAEASARPLARGKAAPPARRRPATRPPARHEA